MPRSPGAPDTDGSSSQMAIASSGSMADIESEFGTAFTPSAPVDDDEFLATLFPHPLPGQSPATSSVGPSPFSMNSYLRTEEDRSLFNHYLHVVSRALCRTRDVDANPFLTVLLPMAAASEMVTSVILSLSGCHWKRVYPNIWRRALRRQGEGTRPLNIFHGVSN